MNMEFYEKLIDYYKMKIESDEKLEKRVQSEEKDAYRVMKALRDSKHPITIKNIGDLARLLNVAKQLTLSGGRNVFEEFISIPQVEAVIKNMTARKPEEIQAIQDYDSSGWGPNETPLEQEHRQIEDFRTANTDEMYLGTISKASNIITSGRHIQIKTDARTEEELSNRDKSILAISKIIMRINGLLPNSELQFEGGRVILDYTDAEKEFSSDIVKEHGQTMGITPAQVEEKKKEEEIHKAALERWTGRKHEEDKKRQQSVADKWKPNPNAKRESTFSKQKRGNDRGMSR